METGTWKVKTGLAQMLKGGVIMDVVTPEHAKIAEEAGAWILSDEVYHGAEFRGEPAQSFYGNYDKVIITNGLSKAYGLPGLRIGWIVAPEELITKTWPYHDYTTIAPSILCDRLAQIVLTPHNREKILARTKDILEKNKEKLSRYKMVS